MITPDSKDWTWVLDRTCPECGFDAELYSRVDVAGLIRRNAKLWEQLLSDGLITRARPDQSTWSPLEYACHVRDVFSIFELRIGLMLTTQDPLFVNWDQDLSATTERYNEQDPATVIDELAVAAETVAHQLDGVQETQWQRPGRRSDGAFFTVEKISRFMIHDLIHHIWDVTRVHRF